jgi:hypothetical protein
VSGKSKRNLVTLKTYEATKPPGPHYDLFRPEFLEPADRGIGPVDLKALRRFASIFFGEVVVVLLASAAASRLSQIAECSAWDFCCWPWPCLSFFTVASSSTLRRETFQPNRPVAALLQVGDRCCISDQRGYNHELPFSSRTEQELSLADAAAVSRGPPLSALVLQKRIQRHHWIECCAGTVARRFGAQVPSRCQVQVMCLIHGRNLTCLEREVLGCGMPLLPITENYDDEHP